MSHLSTDRLAALADEEPSAAEAAHLAECAACTREVAAHRSLLAMARAEADAVGLPLTRWESIAAALPSSAGDVQRDAQRRRPRRHLLGAPMRAAAGLLLLAGGVAVGRASAGAPPIPTLGASSRPSDSTAASPPGQTASGGAFSSIEQARLAQLRSEALYQQAAAFIAEHDSSAPVDESPIAYRSRLAALDQVISTTREAMRQAPHDPVINGYYLTTLGQREATLRQLNTVLPASLRSNSF